MVVAKASAESISGMDSPPGTMFPARYKHRVFW
jgi:hypothetical protein